MPRTAGAQHDWLAKGNGCRVKPGTERPGDLASVLAVFHDERIYFSTESVEPRGSRARTNDRWPDVVESTHHGLW